MKINIVLDFTSGYDKELIKDLRNVGLVSGQDILSKCQKWVQSQNYAIVKSFQSISV